MALFQACYLLFILHSLGSPPPHTHRESVLGKDMSHVFHPQSLPYSRLTYVVEKGMNQSINQWVLRNFSTLTIYHPLSKPFFSSPLAPFKGPWAYLACTPLHRPVTATHLQPHLPPPPRPRALSSCKLSRGLSIAHPGVHTPAWTRASHAADIRCLLVGWLGFLG